MQESLSPVRFSSCRGVSFEAKPYEDPLTISEDLTNIIRMKFLWLRNNNSQVFSSSSIQRSLSRPSSHFCDIDYLDEENHSQSQQEEEEEENYPYHLEEGNVNEEKQLPKPSSKKKSRLSIILLDQGLFTMYKKLFTICLILNITGLVLASTGYFPYARQKPFLFSIGNIFALTLCRSEAFLRLVFSVTVAVFGRSCFPLFIKTSITSFLQSLGGIHSGCGVSSIAWLIYALILTLKENTSPGLIGIAFAILGLLFLSALSAFPLIRHLYHNIFERTHRFAGWTALSLLWVFVILTNRTKPGSRLIKQQEFWFTTAITFLIILPWISVRRVPVEISSPSNHATIIKFNGGIKAGLLGRISPSPLSEWHAFGIISDGKKDHMMLAGAVGDFTKSLVSNPPTHLWVRQVQFAGLPYLVNMYERVLLVATGSGICVFLSFLLQESKAEVYVLWVTKEIEQNFGKEIMEMVNGYSKDKILVYDTAVSGRPNMSELCVKAAKDWGVEVVIVTSNPEGSRDVVEACHGAGIAAFGPIWDS